MKESWYVYFTSIARDMLEGYIKIIVYKVISIRIKYNDLQISTSDISLEYKGLSSIYICPSCPWRTNYSSFKSSRGIENYLSAIS